MRTGLLALSLLLLHSSAWAQTGPASHLMTEEEEIAEDEEEDERPPPDVAPRAVPDYDGRGETPSSAGRKLLWIPRLLFAPLYFVTEFLLRRPLSYLSRLAEQGSGDPLRFFVFGDRQQVAIAPTLLIDFGDSPSAGFYLRIDEVFHPNFKMRYRFATWGRDWLRLSSIWRWEPQPHERYRFEVVFDIQRRADGRYSGLGSEIGNDNGARFQFRMFDLLLNFEAEPWRASHVRAYLGFHERRFSDDVFRGRTIEERVVEGAFALPARYPDGYWAWVQGFEVVINTRKSRPGNTSGLLLQVHGEHAFDIEDLNGARWVHYGGSIGGFLDVSAAGHVIAVHLSARVVEPIRGAVPFTETIDLGGQGPLRGFRYGRLRGLSSATLVFQYSWPIWGYLDAIAHVGLGNVYDGRFDDFDIDNQRVSFGIGFGAIDEADHRFEFTIAWGTNPLDEDRVRVVSTRVAVGATLEF
ncbi:MAG: hypothetical protein AAGE52_04570 [Myxococcota bacterium]